MAVNLTLKKTLVGGAIADLLSGGSSGLDLGQVTNSEYIPLTNQVSNLGHQDIYVEHDAAVDPVDDFGTFVSIYSGSYGGPNSAAADIATVISKGQADNELTANNSDGLSSGFRIEHDGFGIGGLGLNAFLPSRGQVNIYGNSGTVGIDLASKIDLHVDALVYNNVGVEVDAITPETGKIGKAGDTILGTDMHSGVRFYLEDAAADGGILQWDWVFAYSFTA